MSLESCMRTFLDFPTELLILILLYLPAVELCAVQRTCHRIRSIVGESAHLQYVLHAQINGVDDLLPPDRSFSERLELLRRHEKSWNNLQLKTSHEFAATIHQRHFLQDGYLIYNKIAGTLQYGYVDLLSASPNEELCWNHISKEDIRFPLCVAFAVDHNLAVVLRYGNGFLSATFGCNT
jgi:F-box-like